MKWNVEEDAFLYTITPKDKPLTRRGILSVTSALYDSLGLVSPVTLTPKLLLQQACRMKLDYDEDVPDAQKKTMGQLA